MQQQNEGTKPFYDSKFMFSKVMNRSIKHAVKRRLEVLLKDEEFSLNSWEERCRRLLNKTRQEQVERNYLKRISAFRVVIWMLGDIGDRTGDLPPLVIKRKKDMKPKKESKLLPPSQSQLPVISQDALNMLESL